jgi:hypothetical protein
MMFMDGGTANSADSNTVNRYYNNINAILVRVTLESDYTDPRSNGGLPLKRTFTYRVQPRNLLYERNRDN